MRTALRTFLVAALGASLIAGIALAGGGNVGKLSFLNAKFDGQGGVDGIEDPYGVAASGDGENVYAVGSGDNAVASFKRRNNGKLRFLDALFDGQDGVDGIESPGAVAAFGRNVYVTGENDDALATFRRRQDGTLRFVEAHFDGQEGVDGLLSACCQISVAPDGRHLYVASDGEDAVAIFRRNGDSGELTFVDAVFDGVGDVDGLADAEGVIVSNSGRYVYAIGAGDSSVVAFKRRDNGRLRFLGAKFDGQGGVNGLAGPCCSVAISEDDQNVYVPAPAEEAVSVFKVKGDGTLKFLQAKFDDQGGVEFMAEPDDVVVTPDGRSAYVAAFDDGAIVIFRRRDSGKLRFVGAKRDGAGGVDGLDGVWRLALKGNASLYGAGFSEDAVAAFERRR
jgi:6-phosphogluconolactonase (cycloisomerase 2 family)